MLSFVKKQVKTNILKNKEHGAAKQFILLGAPFLLYFVAIICISIFVFNAFVTTSPLWNALIADKQSVSADSVDDQMDYVNPSVVFDAEKKYFSLDEFPKIRWGKKWATLTVEYLGANEIPVYNGDTDDVLNAGIGRYFNSRFPGCGGNCVLSFHVNRQKELYFLEDLPVGETVVLNTVYGKYVYKVESKDIYSVKESSYITRDEGEMLTIYTCYPKQGPYRKYRIALTCRMVEELSDPTWR